MTNILIAGYYGLDNIGDEAILAGMVTSLKKYIPCANISVLTNNPKVTNNLHNVHTVEQSFKKGMPTFFKNGILNGEFSNIYKAIDNCDIFILGGGSLLQDLKLYYLPALYAFLSLAQVKGKITVVYGIGAGPIDTKFGKLLSKKILNNTDLVTVRDSMSKTVLDNCGVKNVIQTVDPAFGIDIPNKKEIELAISNEKNSNQNVISATLYNWLHDSDLFSNPTKSSLDLQSRRQCVANIYDRIINDYDVDFIFIPTVKNDFEGYLEINKLISTNERSSVKEYRNDFLHTFSLISMSDILVGMRLHSMILATIMGVPFVPVSYCGKVKSYLELLDMSDFYLDVENIVEPDFEDALFNNFEKIFSNKEYYSNLLLDKAEKYKQVALENAKMVAELAK